MTPENPRTILAQTQALAARLSSDGGTIRVMRWRGSWCIFSCGTPLVEGIESEADAWWTLAALCLERARK